MISKSWSEQLVGPAHKSRWSNSNWTSAILSLQQGSDRNLAGHFLLELWRFFEAWQMPAGQSRSSKLQAPKTSKPGQPSNPTSILHREETRVTLSGAYEFREVPAVQLSGFFNESLNQVYALEPGLEVSGEATWWSEDGRYFLYFAAEHQHWKVNGIRAVGGDGVDAVRPGCHKAGCGFAHSGPVSSSCQKAIFSGDGWFEVDDGEWSPLQPSPRPQQAWSFSFDAQMAEAEESASIGEESTAKEKRSGSSRFHGLRYQGPSSGAVLLFLPPPPGPDNEGAVGLTGPVDAQNEELINAAGEPDLLLLKPSASKL